MTHFAFTSPIVLIANNRHCWISKHSLCPQARSNSSVRRPNVPRAVVSVQHGLEYFTGVEPQSDYVYKSSDGLTFHERARQLAEDGILSRTVSNTLISWYRTYNVAALNNPRVTLDSTEFTELMFSTLLELSRRATVSPIQFESAHKRLRRPFDYYKFSFDFASVILNRDESTVHGQENINRAFDYIRNGENVIFLSNHQSEGDPYAIDILFDWIAGCDQTICERIHFMAGDRVREDPVVIPFSAGRNLLTVYSKKHINDVPELREHKLLHNKRTMTEAQRMFKDGGHMVWLAPSGGRDRRNPDTGLVEVSRFDDGAIDMMKITAKKSGKPCHFFPMSLVTFEMMPPPSQVGGAELGEELKLEVDMLLQMCHLSPWKIEVYASFVTPRDMRLIISDLATLNAADWKTYTISSL